MVISSCPLYLVCPGPKNVTAPGGIYWPRLSRRRFNRHHLLCSLLHSVYHQRRLRIHGSGSASAGHPRREGRQLQALRVRPSHWAPASAARDINIRDRLCIHHTTSRCCCRSGGPSRCPAGGGGERRGGQDGHDDAAPSDAAAAASRRSRRQRRGGRRRRPRAENHLRV